MRGRLEVGSQPGFSTRRSQWPRTCPYTAEAAARRADAEKCIGRSAGFGLSQWRHPLSGDVRAALEAPVILSSL